MVVRDKPCGYTAPPQESAIQFSASLNFANLIQSVVDNQPPGTFGQHANEDAAECVQFGGTNLENRSEIHCPWLGLHAWMFCQLLQK